MLKKYEKLSLFVDHFFLVKCDLIILSKIMILRVNIIKKI